MQEYEVNTIIENLPYLDRNLWEQNRFAVYSNIQIHSKKKLSPTDIVKFAWDSESIDTETEITNEDIERLKNKAEQIYKSINNGKGT